MHLTKSLCVRLAAAALAAGSLLTTALAAPGVVTAEDGLRLRSESNTDSAVLALLPTGTTVDVTDAVGDGWYHVAFGDKMGYVSSQYIELREEISVPASVSEAPAVAEDETVYGVVTASSLNVRALPSTDSEKVSSLSSGTQIELLETLDGWHRIEGGYVSADYVTVLDGSITARQAEIVAYSMNFLGYPYVYGGSGPNSFDCSGLVKYVYNHFGYSINRTATQQLQNGITVSKSELQPGDLVFFNSAGTGVNKASHVGIYIGGGEFIHASSPKVGVVISDLNSSYYTRVYTTARRIVM